jgi:hypothetical protein
MAVKNFGIQRDGAQSPATIRLRAMLRFFSEHYMNITAPERGHPARLTHHPYPAHRTRGAHNPLPYLLGIARAFLHELVPLEKTT